MQEHIDQHLHGENSVKARERQASIISKQRKKERARQKLEERRAKKLSAAVEEENKKLEGEETFIDTDEWGVNGCGLSKIQSYFFCQSLSSVQHKHH